MGPNQTYKLLHSKEAICKMKRQPMDWEKYFQMKQSTKAYFPKYATYSTP